KNNGELQWKYRTEAVHTGAPTILDSSLFIAGRDGILHHINKNNGQLVWKFKMGKDLEDYSSGWDYFMPKPTIYNNMVLIGCGDGFIYALNIDSGALEWKYKTQGRIRATALVHENRIYQPSNDGYLYVLNAKTGEFLWKFETDGARYDPKAFRFDRSSIFATPLIKNNVLILGSRDGNVYAIDLKSQKEKWRFSYGTTWAMSTSIAHNTLFVGWSTNNLFCALDLATGEEKWRFKSKSHIYTTALITKNGVYTGGADGRILKLDKETGEILWEYEIGKEIFSSLISDSETLYFGSDNGYFYALEEVDGDTFKAVYEPKEFNGREKYLISDKKITPFLVEHSFEHLDTKEKLTSFIESRIMDELPSVVVFNFSLIPNNLVGTSPSQGLIRKYLEKGGKIIWLYGDVPNFYELNEKGSFKRDASIGKALLGVSYRLVLDTGNYYSVTTQQGLNMGIPNWLKTTGSSVNVNGDVVPLAYDEFGNVHCWMKQFSTKPHSGFIALRSWGYNTPIEEDNLDLIEKVASYGLD
ncbi:MAG: PQQ-binding-like beta-propeller repeat protein, partial [Flavobacteriaceae bacterium]